MLTVVMYVFQVLARTVGRRRRDRYTLKDVFMILGFRQFVFDMTLKLFMPCFEWKYFIFKMKNLFENLRCYNWYQSLGLRDSGAPSGVTELKPRI